METIAVAKTLQQKQIEKLNDEYARIVGEQEDERTADSIRFMYPSARVRRAIPTITTTAIGK